MRKSLLRISTVEHNGRLLIASKEPDILMLTEVIPKRQVNPIEES